MLRRSSLEVTTSSDGIEFAGRLRRFVSSLVRPPSDSIVDVESGSSRSRISLKERRVEKSEMPAAAAPHDRARMQFTRATPPNAKEGRIIDGLEVSCMADRTVRVHADLTELSRHAGGLSWLQRLRHGLPRTRRYGPGDDSPGRRTHLPITMICFRRGGQRLSLSAAAVGWSGPQRCACE